MNLFTGVIYIASMIVLDFSKDISDVINMKKMKIRAILILIFLILFSTTVLAQST
jgi:hypothetical protein